MNIFTKNIDSCPYTGTRLVNGKVRVKTHEEASWLDGYFNGDANYVQVNGLTRGKTYDIIEIEGYGDCEDVVIINDNGKKEKYADFFFSVQNI